MEKKPLWKQETEIRKRAMRSFPLNVVADFKRIRAFNVIRMEVSAPGLPQKIWIRKQETSGNNPNEKDSDKSH